jgi:nitroreductase/dihydropteridine reductase
MIKGWFDKQVSLSLGILLSACAVMGIDETSMEGIEPENYETILGQTDYATIVAVAIGYRAEDHYKQPSKNPKSRRSLTDVETTI